MSQTGPPMTGIPRINDPAPDFEATSTHGVIRLSDFTKQGKWVLLFSHPADFTPVCSTELVDLARRSPDFEAVNTQLIGVSVDSIYSHIAWTRSLAEKLGQDIPYPIIADLDTRVAQLYGMIHPGASATATVRAVFVIDPKQVVRALVYYPMQAGRNIDELLRIVQALQTVDANGVSTPANWRPGDAVLVPAPATTDAAKTRAEGSEGYDVVDWYLSTKKLA
ncbi:MAG TPA: peroxiredoxin [Candidatus Dormibacteraeota bacterium]|jgi:peroxiredoxin (alkyl hydroperoxide reductase subunit C)|nr:peroxiredoxin [Candidatus Dormibacteraeota bacterium]